MSQVCYTLHDSFIILRFSVFPGWENIKVKCSTEYFTFRWAAIMITSNVVYFWWSGSTGRAVGGPTVCFSLFDPSKCRKCTLRKEEREPEAFAPNEEQTKTVWPERLCKQTTTKHIRDTKRKLKCLGLQFFRKFWSILGFINSFTV